MLRPLRNNIMFKFLDDTGGAKGTFGEGVRASGIIIPKIASAQKVSRWGQVVAAGPESDLNEGDYILIEPLAWSFGVTWNDEKIWKTDDSKVLAVTDDVTQCQTQAL